MLPRAPPRRLQRERHARSTARRSLGPYAPAVPMDNPPHRREADPGSRKIGHRMEPLKWREQLRRVRRIESDAVVTNEKDRRAIRTSGGCRFQSARPAAGS